MSYSRCVGRFLTSTSSKYWEHINSRIHKLPQLFTNITYNIFLMFIMCAYNFTLNLCNVHIMYYIMIHLSMLTSWIKKARTWLKLSLQTLHRILYLTQSLSHTQKTLKSQYPLLPFISKTSLSGPHLLNPSSYWMSIIP